MPTEWLGTPFTLVDTGGLFGASEDPLHELVVLQGRKALETADVIVFVVDGRDGLVSADEEIADSLAVGRRAGPHRRQQDRRPAGRRTAPSSSIGWASNRSSRLPPSTAQGTGDLLDEVVKRLPGAVGDGPAESRAGRSRGRHRRPSERRQVVAAQSVAQRRARRSSATCRGRRGTASTRCFAGSGASSESSTRPGFGAPARSARSGQLEGRQRRPRPPRDREGGRDRARHRFIGRRRRPGCDDRRRGREGGQRHHHRRQQMGSDEGAGAGLLQEVRRRAAAADQVPRLRARASHLGGDRRAHDQGARDDRQGGRGAAAAACRPASSTAS